MTIAIVDYGAGNLRSVEKALIRAGGADVIVTADADRIAKADRVVLPGDGAFPDCRRALDSASGLGEALNEAVLDRGRPFLGICIGMQLLATTGEEHEPTAGLNWIPGRVLRIEPGDARLKVPHMGWNTLIRRRAHPLTDDLPVGPDGLHAYFLHAFHLKPDDAGDVALSADYGGDVTALVARGNVAGAQFHPEKSQTLGLSLLASFLRWRP
ncbi:imidazole glycerol phosphate synthase subunit HisH [Methylopila jiangsuensis]|uniref:Imidazole glycerol phosphate synthase subunit HisH n=1 Tax=Methylopila jiangsuensis TaxID=586230 RepID=A0A9W6JI11_9HYPH|nr:imidazole glycerol phosphate synthase subunit HisH [Methylopila jiangsuensis]MDR6285029.1 glutamine amidotransferase [Methylopila jiangsuensis]GLK77582.1 imidazole glycerol phosphate synthase subunit HisH [Methylopila jiangsuensis]